MSHSQSIVDAPAQPVPAGAAGPVAPTAAALGALAPLGLGDAQLDPAGLLGSWQVRNAAATLPHCIEQLDRTGALANLRLAADGAGGGDGLAGGGEPGWLRGPSGTAFAGMWFADSDVYKTLEAAGWELARPDADPGLRDFVAQTAALLARAQGEDGYLNSYFTVVRPDVRFQQLDWSHELYCAGHLIQAAVAVARGGAGPELLAVARRFADLLVETFGPGGVDGVCGHPEIETALVELYRLTGHRPYLDLAARFVDLRGTGLLGEGRFGRQYFQDHVPVRAAEEGIGHAVRQLYLLAGVVDVAVETGDESLLAAAIRLWESIFGSKTYLTGGHGSRHRDEAFGDPYELPPDRAYNETCASIASFHWNWRMLLATGEARYADVLERTLYNVTAASSAVDGRHFFYSNPLQLRTGHDGSHEDSPSRRLPWYSCPCCPPNRARLMASLQAYLATTDAGGLQLHLFAAATVRADIGGPVEVEVRTEYPWQGRLALTVASAAEAPWTLSVRVPGWCTRFAVTVDGEPVEAPVDGGYLRLHRDWAARTEVLVDLDMPARLVAPHPHVDAARGCLAVARGPLVYCLEQADLPAGAVLEDVLLDPTAPVTVDGAAGITGAVMLTLPAVLAPPAVADLYQRPSAVTGTPVQLAAVPYFLWGNRTPGAMRVWLPTAPAAPTTPAGPTAPAGQETVS
jgi:DUF1680 family protein